MALDPSKLIWTSIAALLISLPLLVIFFLKLWKSHESKLFPFLELPPELRDMIYLQLIEGDLAYRVPRRSAKSVSSMEWLFSKRRVPPNTNLIMLTNRQIYQEFSEILCMEAKFTLLLDDSSLRMDKFWDINPETLKDMRKCEVLMITTSNMLGHGDPHDMPRQWPVCDRVCDALKACTKLEELSLQIRSLGDHLLNPLWLWYYASQSFKTAEFNKFNRITFSLDGWSPVENHLVRNKDGQWKWRCSAEHLVMSDSGRWQPIREFCHSLYKDCQECLSERKQDSD